MEDGAPVRSQVLGGGLTEWLRGGWGVRETFPGEGLMKQAEFVKGVQGEVRRKKGRQMSDVLPTEVHVFNWIQPIGRRS